MGVSGWGCLWVWWWVGLPVGVSGWGCLWVWWWVGLSVSVMVGVVVGRLPVGVVVGGAVFGP